MKKLFKKYILAGMAVLFTGCGSVEAGPLGNSNGYRCATDGFCLTRNDGTLFYGGFRRGEREIKFNVAFHRVGLINWLMGATGYCSMLTAENNKPLAESNSACRPEWKGTPQDSPAGTSYADYQPIGRLLLDYLHANKHPDGREGEWLELTKAAERIAYAVLTLPGTSQEKETMLKVYLPDNIDALIGIANQSTSTDVLRDNLNVYGSNKINDEGENEDDVEGKDENEDEDEDKEYTKTDAEHRPDGELKQVPPKPVTKRILGGSGDVAGNHIPRAQIVYEPTREYRQVVEIWSQKARLFLDFGPKIGSEHSGTFTRIYWRPIGTNDDWIILFDKKIGNHGAEPFQGDMRLLRTCEDGVVPVTQGFYYFGGECSGAFGIEHLCNDDTAYQLRSSIGVWTPTFEDGKGACHDTHRFTAPHCWLPW